MITDFESKRSAKADDRRLKVFWTGAAICSIAFVRIIIVATTGKAPLMILILAAILDVLMLAAFLVAIREVRKRKAS
jgi:hypothetical protein